MSSADEVLLKIRAEGWKAAAKVVRDTEKAIKDAKKAADKKPTGGAGGSWLGQLGHTLRGLPASWRAGQAGATQFRRSLSGIGSDVAGLTRTITGAGAAVAGLTGLGGGALLGSQIFGGLGDNEAFQNARTSFKTFLGDAEKANAFVEDLRGQVSNGSPFKLTDIFGNARQLLAFNLNAEQSLKVLESVKGAALASGSGARGFDRISLALGQVAAKGKLSAEEMLQLAEAGVPVQKYIRSAFSLSDKEMGDIGNMNIPANAALWAITEGWDKDFAEAAENAKDDATNQRAQISKNWEQLRRLVTEPLFKELNDKVYPQVSDALGNAVSTFGRQDLEFDAKAKLAWDGLRADLGPLWSEIEDGVASLDLDEKLRDAAVAGLDLAVKGVVAGAPKVAGAFWDAFTDMSAMGKLVTVAFLWNRLRLPFWAVGAKGASMLAKGLWGAGGSVLGKVGSKLGGTVVGKAAEGIQWRGMLLGEALTKNAGPGLKTAAGALGKTFGVGLMAAAAFWIIKDHKKIAQALGGDSRDVKLSDGSTVDAWGQGQSIQRVKDGKPFGEGDLRTLAAIGRRDGKDESTIAAQMEELRRRTTYRPRASGGTVRPGEFTIVGERGPELARFPAGTEITSNRQARAQGAGSRSGSREVIYRTPIVSVLHASGRELARVVNEHDEIVELRR